MKLLLHSCCAPCSTEVICRLKEKYQVTLFFYNPNIHPRKEYEKRLWEQKKLAQKLGIQLIKGQYTPDDWLSAVKGLENEPENGRRCEICYRMRLLETAKLAKKEDFPVFTTTLTISPHKNSEIINSIGNEISNDMGVEYLSEDFKKKNGFGRSIEHSRKHDLYRQDYCGCIYSMR